MPSFRRLANPFVMDVSASSAATQVAINGDPKFPSVGQGRSFVFINPNPFCVRLRGSTSVANGGTGFQAVTETTGWLFLPWSSQVYASQLPDWVSVMAVTRGGMTAGVGTCELAYGTGS